MKNRELFIKIVLFGMIFLLLLSLAAPAIFPQASGTPAKETLLNGLRVYMWPDRQSSDITVRIRIHSGSAFDPQGKEGVMHMLAESLFPTTAAKEYFAEDLGGSLSVVSGYDLIEVRATAKAEHLLSVLETLSSAVSNPTIDKETAARLRGDLTTRLKGLEQDPAYVAERSVAGRLFGTFPYGRPQFGTPGSVANISFADLIDAKQRFLGADNATVAIAGRFDRELAFRAVRRYFGSWLKSDRRVPSTFRQPDAPSAEVLALLSPVQSPAMVNIASRGVARGDKQLAATAIAAEVLAARLRTRFGSGGVSVRSQAYMLPGMIIAAFPADADGPAAVVEKALTDPITDAEFQTAAAAARAAFEARGVITMWLDADTFNFAAADVEKQNFAAVTAADVRAAAERLRRQPAAVVVMRPAPASS